MDLLTLGNSAGFFLVCVYDHCLFSIYSHLFVIRVFWGQLGLCCCPGKKEKRKTHNQPSCLYSHPHGARHFLGMKLTDAHKGSRCGGHMSLAAFFLVCVYDQSMAVDVYTVP